MLLEISIIIIFILVNGFFSLSEMAIVSSRKARLRQRAEAGHKGAQLAMETAEKPGRFLSTVQIVITLMGTIAGAFGGATVAEELVPVFLKLGLSPETSQPLAFGIVVAITTFLSVVFGELVPKNLALARPETIAGFVAYPMRFFSFIFAPVVRVLTGTTDLVLHIFGAKHSDEPQVTEEEVKVLITQGTETGIFDKREQEMFEGILYLGDKKAATFMTPRTDVVFLEKSESHAEHIASLIANARFSVLPVVEDGDIDHLVGIVQVKPALAAIAAGKMGSIDAFIEKPLFVPESLSALELFSRFKSSDTRIAILIDEYGGVSGMVTFSDLAETILGEVETAGTAKDPEITTRADGSFLVDGSLSIDDLIELLDLEPELFSGDYETLAGFVLDTLGSIPRAGESFPFESWTFEIMDMDGNRIDKVLLYKAKPAAGKPDGND
jgi:putative hemolysin